MNRFRKKMHKTSIFGHFGPKWPILYSFWPKWAKRDFFKKALGTFFSRLQALTNCKVSGKSNERFSRNRVTDVRTDVNPQFSNDFVERPKMTQIWSKRAIFEFSPKIRKRDFSDFEDQAQYKKLANSNEQIAKKCKKPPFWGNFGPKWPILDSFWSKWAKREFFKKAL